MVGTDGSNGSWSGWVDGGNGAEVTGGCIGGAGAAGVSGTIGGSGPGSDVGIDLGCVEPEGVTVGTAVGIDVGTEDLPAKTEGRGSNGQDCVDTG